MDLLLIPGYKTLLGNPLQTYEELLQTLSSDYTIALAIAINNELEVSSLTEEENQIRLQSRMFYRFNLQQRQSLENAYEKLRIKSNGLYKNIFFAKRYLLEMIVREVKRNFTVEMTEDLANEEYKFFLAYLMIIDETNKKDHDIMDGVEATPNDNLTQYRHLWTPTINQYHFNENSAAPYEMYKLTSFLMYVISCSGRPVLHPIIAENRLDDKNNLFFENIIYLDCIQVGR